MLDILEKVDVEVPCEECGDDFCIRASVIRESQELLQCGCPGSSPYECPATWFASLVEPDALSDLERAWSRFNRSARNHGGGARIAPQTRGKAAAVPLAAAKRERRILDRAIAAWESEGGHLVPAAS